MVPAVQELTPSLEAYQTGLHNDIHTAKMDWMGGARHTVSARSGYILMLLGSIPRGLDVLVLHMRGAELVGGRIAIPVESAMGAVALA